MDKDRVTVSSDGHGDAALAPTAAILAKLDPAQVLLLHDRRLPGSRANIDHIAVTSAGIWVIDSKRYTGRPRLKATGGLFRPRVEMCTSGPGIAPDWSMGCWGRPRSCIRCCASSTPTGIC